MTAKLGQMNSVVERVARELDDDTLLFVLGDHGMTAEGDHGGDSHLETEAALFVHSRHPFALNWEQLSPFLATAQLTKVGPEEVRVVPQIDFVPTLSLALGLPIPFGNLGKVIPELILAGSQGLSLIEELERANDMLRINTRQVRTYLEKYASVSSSFSQETLQQMDLLYEQSEGLFRSLGLSRNLSQEYISSCFFFS